MSIRRQVLGWSLATLCWVFAFGAWAADPVGRIAYLRGGGVVQAPGEPARPLSLDLQLRVTDTVSTAKGSAVRIAFADKTDAWLGPEAIFTVDRFQTDRDDAAFVASILKGTFRIVTGLIARNRPRAVQVNIFPTSTIGIRGTQFGGEVRENSAGVVLLEQENGTAANAIEVSNQFGGVLIDEPGFGTEIADEFSPPSPPRRMQIRSVENLLRSMQSIQRLQVPRLPR